MRVQKEGQRCGRWMWVQAAGTALERCCLLLRGQTVAGVHRVAQVRWCRRFYLSSCIYYCSVLLFSLLLISLVSVKYKSPRPPHLRLKNVQSKGLAMLETRKITRRSWIEVCLSLEPLCFLTPPSPKSKIRRFNPAKQISRIFGQEKKPQQLSAHFKLSLFYLSPFATPGTCLLYLQIFIWNN